MKLQNDGYYFCEAFAAINNGLTLLAHGRGAGCASPAGIQPRKRVLPLAFFCQFRPAPVKPAVGRFLAKDKVENK